MARDLSALFQATDDRGQPLYATRDLCLLVAATLLRSSGQLNLEGQGPLVAAALQELGLAPDADAQQLQKAIRGQEIDPELLAALEQFSAEASSMLKARSSAKERNRLLGGPAPAAPRLSPNSRAKAGVSVNALQKARSTGKHIIR